MLCLCLDLLIWLLRGVVTDLLLPAKLVEVEPPLRRWPSPSPPAKYELGCEWAGESELEVLLDLDALESFEVKADGGLDDMTDGQQMQVLEMRLRCVTEAMMSLYSAVQYSYAVGRFRVRLWPPADNHSTVQYDTVQYSHSTAQAKPRLKFCWKDAWRNAA